MIKPPVFWGTNSKDTFEFLIDFHEFLIWWVLLKGMVWSCFIFSCRLKSNNGVGYLLSTGLPYLYLLGHNFIMYSLSMFFTLIMIKRKSFWGWSKVTCQWRPMRPIFTPCLHITIEEEYIRYFVMALNYGIQSATLFVLVYGKSF